MCIFLAVAGNPYNLQQFSNWNGRNILIREAIAGFSNKCSTSSDGVRKK